MVNIIYKLWYDSINNMLFILLKIYTNRSMYKNKPIVK